MRWSVAEISSAILIQLVVWGRSSGPRAGEAAAWVGAVVVGGGRCGSGSTSAAAGGCGGGSGRCARKSRRAEGIDQAGIHGESFAFDEHGVGGDGDVLADGFDESIANDHGALGDDGAGDGYDLRVVDGHCRMGLGEGQSATHK